MIMAEVDWGLILEKAIEAELIPVILGIPFVIVILSLIAWASTRKTRLKQKMVERGFTAAQIEQVLKAGKE